MKPNHYQNHYDNILAEHYSWAFGGQKENIEKNKNLFQDLLDQNDHNGKVAIDLGAGSGFQSIPLADMGHKVHAIDTCKELLKQAKNDSATFNINYILGDILELPKLIKQKSDLIVCMGDTLSHLTNWDEIKSLIKNCYQQLNPKGKLIISYRDLSDNKQGTDRIIPVQATHNKIMTCFLEYDEEFVMVNDIIYENKDNKWEFKTGSYRKIKIPIQDLLSLL